MKKHNIMSDDYNTEYHKVSDPNTQSEQTKRSIGDSIKEFINVSRQNRYSRDNLENHTTYHDHMPDMITSDQPIECIMEINCNQHECVIHKRGSPSGIKSALIHQNTSIKNELESELEHDMHRDMYNNIQSTGSNVLSDELCNHIRLLILFTGNNFVIWNALSKSDNNQKMAFEFKNTALLFKRTFTYIFKIAHLVREHINFDQNIQNMQSIDDNDIHNMFGGKVRHGYISENVQYISIGVENAYKAFSEWKNLMTNEEISPNSITHNPELYLHIQHSLYLLKQAADSGKYILSCADML